MRNWIVLSALILLCFSTRQALFAADPNEEQQLILKLQSDASPKDKDAACARLKWIGTALSVPALGNLLLDEQLSHSARYALESVPFEQAGNALLDALARSTGLTRVGLINSLGIRAEARAVPPLAKLLSGSDPAAALASATALGRIGGSQSIEPLQTCAGKSSGPLHDAAVDGLLRIANQLLATGDQSAARKLFQALYDHETREHLQIAAYRGLIRASGQDGLPLMKSAIAGKPGAAQVAALQLVPEFEATDATEQLASLLPKLDPQVQIALVGGLGQKGDPAALSELAALASKSSAEAHPALIHALAKLGDASVVPVLAGFAASGGPEEQSAARLALTELNRGEVSEALVNQIPSSTPAVQTELVRAIGDRGEQSAFPKLLALAQAGPDNVRKAALHALGALAGPAQISSLVRYLLDAKDDASRAQSAEALNTASQRLQSRHGQFDVESIAAALSSGSADARIALLPVCGGVVAPQIRLGLRKALEDPEPRVRAAAVRALCDSNDIELLDDMVALARQTQQDNFRTLAIGGAVRLLTQEEAAKLSTSQRVGILNVLLSTATRAEQKRRVLAGLAEIPSVEALKVVETTLPDPELRAETARAAIKIAAALPSSEAQNSAAILRKAMSGAPDDATLKAIQDTLSQIETTADYLTDWQVAGPFRQEKKDYAALFDIIFPPEVGNAQGVAWRALPSATDPKRPFVLDLLKTLGGEQCVGYARTWIHSDQETPALLELSSDDGVKVWLNDKQVYALNIARPLQPGSDKINVTLRPGWNPLLLKITQNNLGWEFCARFRKPDGSHLDGLRFDAEPKK